MNKIAVAIFLLIMGYPSVIPHTTLPKNPAPKPFTAISEKELVCLAKNIAYEASDEPYEGKLAVATVTMNRVTSSRFPKTVCSVVYQRNKRGCQFSWTCATPRTLNTKIYTDAKKIAEDVLTKNIRVVSIKNALYFHNTSIAPNWSSFAKPVKQIGNHIFYVVKSNGKSSTNKS